MSAGPKRDPASGEASLPGQIAPHCWACNRNSALCFLTVKAHISTLFWLRKRKRSGCYHGPVHELVIDCDLFDSVVEGGGCPIEVLYPEFADHALVAGYSSGDFIHLFVLAPEHAEPLSE